MSFLYRRPRPKPAALMTGGPSVSPPCRLLLSATLIGLIVNGAV